MLQRYGQFTASIFNIGRSVQKIEAEEMEKYGLRGSFAQYLAVMVRHPLGLTAAQLCKICNKDKAAVSRAVAEMEDKGLIVKGGNSAYRANLLLTQEGRRAAEYVCRRATIAVEAAGQGLTGEQRQVFYSTLQLIAENLDKISKEGIPEGD